MVESKFPFHSLQNNANVSYTMLKFFLIFEMFAQKKIHEHGIWYDRQTNDVIKLDLCVTKQTCSETEILQLFNVVEPGDLQITLKRVSIIRLIYKKINQ